MLNAANEVAVATFLGGEIRFTDIPRIVEDALAQASYLPPQSIADVLDIDHQTRLNAQSSMKAVCH